jgi:hypothetical protein
METLKKLFYDPKTGFRSSSLYEKAKEIDPSITKAMTKEFLSKQNVVQVFKPRKVKHFYPLIATKPGRLQIDLMDMSNEDTVTNKGRKWLFCAVDIFSRYAFCFPQKSKSDSSCLESLKELIKEAKNRGIVIYQLDSDSESSFQSRQFKALLKANDIIQNLVPVGNKHRVGVVERFNGTVRHFLNRYKTAYKTTDWLSAIPDFIQNYNNTVHRSLQSETPREALTGIGSVPYQFSRTEKAEERDYNKVEFSVGDKVRLRIHHSLFEKKSTGVWTKTIHTVDDIRDNDIYVNDRVEPYRKEDLLLVDESENPDVNERKAEEEERQHKEQKVEKRISRRINKEGIDREKDVVVDENAKVLRRYRKERDMGFMVLV